VQVFDYSSLDWISKSFIIVEQSIETPAQIISDNLQQGKAEIFKEVDWERTAELDKDNKRLVHFRKEIKVGVFE